MGTSALPSPVSPSSLSLPALHALLDDWFSTTYPQHLSAQAVTRDGLSSSSSSSSSSLDRPEGRSFLHSGELDGLPRAAFAQVGSPVISSNSTSKEKPESPLYTNSGCVSAMSNFTAPKANATESSALQHFQAFHGGFNQLGHTIPKPREENTSSSIASILNSASAALSSHASAGAGATKVSKRRARINKKAPIAVLSADTSNFRAMVQQLTGIPPSHAAPLIWASSGAPLLRPQPTRFAYSGGLPTLDTSASFLGPNQILPFLQRAQQPLSNCLLSGGASNSAAEHAPFRGQGNMASYDTSLTSVSGLWDAMGNGAPSEKPMKGNVKELSVSNVLRECEQAFPRPSLNLVESLLMLDDDLPAKSSFNAVDSWLAFDGGVLASHSPRLDLAKIAS